MSFTNDMIQTVWGKGSIDLSNNANLWRKDQCGAWIGREFYGSRDSQYGWEIDHINPSGGDFLSNLRPLQWENNANKSDGRLTCPVVSNGVNNARR